MPELGCGEHTAYMYKRGGVTRLFELDKVISFDWKRVRDDISTAQIEVQAEAECCRQLGGLTTGNTELHIYRDGQMVWLGVLTRIEYERTQITLFAEDILWVAKRTALEVGYNKAYPNIAKAGWVMNWLLKSQTYNKNNDPWKVLPHVHWVQGSDDPSTSAAVKAWSLATWEDFDKSAEDRGMDYTVVGRDIYFWDTHLKWRTIEQELRGEFLMGGMAVVEYGNEFATRVIKTNGNGYAAQAVAPPWAIAEFGYIDLIESTANEAAGNETPTAEEKTAWQQQAQSLLDHSFPAPTRIRVSENSTLAPTCPYTINDLVAGSWLQVVVEDLCRTMDQWHKLELVHVHSESGDEKVTVTTAAAPENMVPL